jgi:hypothetical protein
MIDHIVITDPLLTASLTPKPYISQPAYINSQPMRNAVGIVHYNTATQMMEIFDGQSWHSVSQALTLNTGPRLQAVVSWAENKMREEVELEALMAKHPGLKESKERFDIMLALTKETTNE